MDENSTEEFKESGVINADDLTQSKVALCFGQMNEPQVQG